MTNIRGPSILTGMDLPTKINRLLDERSWSQRDLARRMRRSAQSLNNWMNGVEPKRKDLLIIARALGVSVEYLIDDAQDRPPPPAITPAEQMLLDVIRCSGRSPVEVMAILAARQDSGVLREAEEGVRPTRTELRPGGPRDGQAGQTG